MPQMGLTTKESEALRAVRNWIVHHGRAPSVRKLMEALGYSSPRTAAVLIERLIKKGYLNRRPNKELQLASQRQVTPNKAESVLIPLLGIACCGKPLLAEANVEGWFLVSTKWARPGNRYFFLSAIGDSMTEAGIKDGDLVLVRQQTTAKNGDLVVALIDDEATIKEFRRTENAIVLRPRTENVKHKPILLTDDFQIQGVVQKSFNREEAQLLHGDAITNN